MSRKRISNSGPRQGNKDRPIDFGTPRGRREYWSCTRKLKFVSERIANETAAARGVDGRPLFTYRCRECKNWHLTHYAPGAPKRK